MPQSETMLIESVRPLCGLWRAERTLQIGVDEDPIVLEPVPVEAIALLPFLAEPHTLAELSELTPGLGRAWLEWLLARLGEAGLVRQWRPQRPRPVVVWGTGPLAERLHGALQRAEFQPLPLGQPGWPGPDRPLIVLATGTCEPDRWLTDRITSAGHPTLVVRADSDRGVIGPFIQPRQTPCLRCLDLLRSELDPRWPLLVAQLCRLRTRPAAALVEWLAGEAVAEVGRWRAGELPELAGRTFELSLSRLQRSSVSWAAHPACTCRTEPHWEPVGTLAG